MRSNAQISNLSWILLETEFTTADFVIIKVVKKKKDFLKEEKCFSLGNFADAN